MKKKIASIVLSLVMLLSVISVSAATTAETDAKGRVIYTDDFDHNAENTVVNGKSVPESQILIPTRQNNADTTVARGLGKMLSVTGVDGKSTIAYVSEKQAAKTYMRMRSLDIGSESATKEYLISFDFKVDSVAKGTLFIMNNSFKDLSWKLFNLSTDGKIKTTVDGGASFTDSGESYIPNSWYHVEAVINGTNIKAWMTDSAGNSFYSQGSSVSDAYLSPYYMESPAAVDLALTLDNLKIVEYDPTTVAPEIQIAPVASGTENVQRNVALSFELDQIVSIDESINDVVTLGKVNSDGSITPVTGATLSVAANGRKITVTYPDTELLERNTKYVVSLANLKNASGLPCSENYEFVTEDLHIWEPVTIGTIGSTDSETNLTPITFTITDSYNYPNFDCAALAIVYQDGEMLSCDLQALSNVLVGNCTKNFALGTIPGGATISIVLLNCDSGPIPLASGTATR